MDPKSEAYYRGRAEAEAELARGILRFLDVESERGHPRAKAWAAANAQFGIVVEATPGPRDVSLDDAWRWRAGYNDVMEEEAIARFGDALEAARFQASRSVRGVVEYRGECPLCAAPVPVGVEVDGFDRSIGGEPWRRGLRCPRCEIALSVALEERLDSVIGWVVDRSVALKPA